MNNSTQNPPETNPVQRTNPEISAEPFSDATIPSKYQKTSKNSAKKTHKANIRRLWWLFPILGLVLVIGGISYIRLRDNNQPVTVTQTAPLSVRVATATRELIRAWISSEGTVRAVNYQHLTFDVEGDVTYLANQDGRQLREGDRVKKGQLLARIDDRELTADVTQAQAAIAEARQQKAAAEAEVAQARAQVAQARSQVQEAQAQLQNAQAARRLAATSLERYRSLVEQGAVAEIEFDERQNALEDAQAGVQSARAAVESAQQQVEAAQAQVQAARQQVEAQTSAVTTAQARLSQAEVALEGASIYAPFNGIIAYLNISEGDYFSPQIVTSQLGGDYQGILERIPMVIIDPSRYEVIVDLAGPTGERVETGQNALIASETKVNAAKSSQQTLLTNARAQGEVFAVNPAISPGGRAIEARIRLNPQTTNTLRHGEQVLTWIAVSQSPNAVVVPIDAVVRRDRIPYVFVVNEDEGVVEQREVALGITGITQQAIATGVVPGELVVTKGQNRLVDGAEVDVIN